MITFASISCIFSVKLHWNQCQKSHVNIRHQAIIWANVDSNLCHHMMSLCHYELTQLFQNIPLQWRHNGHDGISNHQPHRCLLNPLFGRRSKKTSKLRVTGPCAGNSPGPVNSPHKWPVMRKKRPTQKKGLIGKHLDDCKKTIAKKLGIVYF